MITMRDLRSVPGWFHEPDVLLFRWFLEEQRRRSILGDLAELGAYQGKSAIVIGEYVRHDETFTVVDLFDDPGSSAENRSENRAHYPGLTQRNFEGHYRRFHTRMPVIVKALTSEVLEHATSGTHRFVHVDASHLYDHVRTDIASARQLLADGGIAVFDDYRATHTPGTAAAVWEAVATDGLQPIVVSANKLYGTWGDPESWIDQLVEWVSTTALELDVQQVRGRRLVRVGAGPTMDVVARSWRDLVPPPLLPRLARLRARQRALTRRA